MNTNEELLEQTTSVEINDVLQEINTNTESTVSDILSDGQEIDSMEEKYTQSLQHIKQLEDQIKTLTSVAATSQSQYLNLKAEFESAQRVRTLEKARDKVSAIVSVAKKFVILTEYMRQFLAHLTPELKEHTLISGLQLSYDKFINTELAGYGIKQIESLGLTPDSELHEVVMMDTATESDIVILNSLGHEGSDFAGRIIREFEVGYYYMDGETRHIIKAAKVVVGQ